jgi:DNA-binding NarL/FixJ family response regulator
MRKTLEPRPTPFSGKRIVLCGERPQEWARRLESEVHFGVFGNNGDADEVLQVIARLRPEVVLLRIPAKGKAWLQLLQRIRLAHLHVKILAVSERTGAPYADRALRAGANGCVVEGEGTGEISAAIRDVLAGHTYVSESFLAAKPKIGAKISGRVKRNSSVRRSLALAGRRCEQPVH